MILVSVLGKYDSSILPLLFEFKEKLSQHIIINDDSTFESIKTSNLINIQKKFKLFYNLDFNIDSIKVDEDSYESLISAFEKIEDIAKDNFHEVYFNGTGGLASTSVVISQKILERNGKFLAYDIFDNGFNIVTKNSLKKKQISENQDIFTHLLLKGYDITANGSKLSAYKRKSEILQICENLEELKKFGTLLQKQSSNSIDGFNKLKTLLQKIGKLEDRSFIQGAIFEEYIYWLIEDNFDFDQVMFGVKIEFDEYLFNEFDILMIKDNHLHTIECKLRTKVAGENVVYKVDSIVDYLDDDGKAMVLAIGGENETVKHNGKVNRQFSQGTLKRAKNLNVKVHQSRVFNKEVFLQDVKEHFFNN